MKQNLIRFSFSHNYFKPKKLFGDRWLMIYPLCVVLGVHKFIEKENLLGTVLDDLTVFLLWCFVLIKVYYRNCIR